MATKTAAEKKAEAEAKKAAKEAEKVAAEEARRAALTDEERAAEDAAKAPAPKKGAKSVKVVDSKTGASRVYSLEVHGEDFRELAEEFAGKVSSRKVVGDAE